MTKKRTHGDLREMQARLRQMDPDDADRLLDSIRERSVDEESERFQDWLQRTREILAAARSFRDELSWLRFLEFRLLNPSEPGEAGGVGWRSTGGFLLEIHPGPLKDVLTVSSASCAHAGSLAAIRLPAAANGPQAHLWLAVMHETESGAEARLRLGSEARTLGRGDALLAIVNLAPSIRSDVDRLESAARMAATDADRTAWISWAAERVSESSLTKEAFEAILRAAASASRDEGIGDSILAGSREARSAAGTRHWMKLDLASYIIPVGRPTADARLLGARTGAAPGEVTVPRLASVSWFDGVLSITTLFQGNDIMIRISPKALPDSSADAEPLLITLRVGDIEIDTRQVDPASGCTEAVFTFPGPLDSEEEVAIAVETTDS